MQHQTKAPDPSVFKSLFRLVLAAALLATTIGGGCHRVAPGNADEDPGQVQQQEWVLRAEGLLAKLAALADTCPKVEPSWEDPKSWNFRASYRKAKRADRLLWRLWLATGMPPLVSVSVDETRRSHWQRNAVAYRQYIDRHRNLSEGDLHITGLANAAVAVGTPLWHPALEYFDRITGVPLGDLTDVRSRPPYIVLGWEGALRPRKQSSNRIASALSVWVKANRGRMLWDSERGRFVARDAEFVGDGALMKQVAEALWLDS